jgi:GNAT superfamily N-acetyltransferase
MRNGSSSVSTNVRKVGGEIDVRDLSSLAGRDGRTIVRAAVPTDAEGLHRMFARCSAETLRLRFHISLLTVSEQVVGFLVGAWPRSWQGRALVALSEGEIVGHAMCVAEEPVEDEAEVAVVVEDAWHGKGVARALLAKLVEEAAELGIKSFRCETLPGNQAAAGLARGLRGQSSAPTSPKTGRLVTRPRSAISLDLWA